MWGWELMANYLFLAVLAFTVLTLLPLPVAFAVAQSFILYACVTMDAFMSISMCVPLFLCMSTITPILVCGGGR
jgi:hypothetical protein